MRLILLQAHSAKIQKVKLATVRGGVSKMVDKFKERRAAEIAGSGGVEFIAHGNESANQPNSSDIVNNFRPAVTEIVPHVECVLRAVFAAYIANSRNYSMGVRICRHVD